MALIGDFTHYYITTGSPTPNITQVTYPLSLPESDPNYSKRGTTETITDYNQEESTTFTSSYLSIGELSTFPVINENGNKVANMFIKYEVYSSKEHKYATSESLFREDINNVEYSFNPNNNDYDFAYNYLQGLKGFENLNQD